MLQRHYGTASIVAASLFVLHCSAAFAWPPKNPFSGSGSSIGSAVDDLRSEANGLKKRLDELSSKGAFLQSIINDKTAKIEKLSGQIVSLTDENKALKAQLARLPRWPEWIDTDAIDIIASLRARIEDLESDFQSSVDREVREKVTEHAKRISDRANTIINDYARQMSSQANRLGEEYAGRLVSEAQTLAQRYVRDIEAQANQQIAQAIESNRKLLDGIQLKKDIDLDSHIGFQIESIISDPPRITGRDVSREWKRFWGDTAREGKKAGGDFAKLWKKFNKSAEQELPSREEAEQYLALEGFSSAAIRVLIEMVYDSELPRADAQFLEQLYSNEFKSTTEANKRKRYVKEQLSQDEIANLAREASKRVSAEWQKTYELKPDGSPMILASLALEDTGSDEPSITVVKRPGEEHDLGYWLRDIWIWLTVTEGGYETIDGTTYDEQGAYEREQEQKKNAERSQLFKEVDGWLDNIPATLDKMLDKLGRSTEQRVVDRAELEMRKTHPSRFGLSGDDIRVSEPGWRTIDGKRDFHEGIDFTSRDAKGKATSLEYTAGVEGEVVKLHGGTVNTISIRLRGSGLIVQYMHSSKIYVKENQKVTPDTVLGKTGKKGADVEHLHVGARTSDFATKIHPDEAILFGNIVPLIE
jgi:murein DD-endopeptidase MepM/ murein hydrolase activator NlpD